MKYDPMNPAHNMAHIIESWSDPVLKELSPSEKERMYHGIMPSRVFETPFGRIARFITINGDALKI